MRLAEQVHQGREAKKEQFSVLGQVLGSTEGIVKGKVGSVRSA